MLAFWKLTSRCTGQLYGLLVRSALMIPTRTRPLQCVLRPDTLSFCNRDALKPYWHKYFTTSDHFLTHIKPSFAQSSLTKLANDDRDHLNTTNTETNFGKTTPQLCYKFQTTTALVTLLLSSMYHFVAFFELGEIDTALQRFSGLSKQFVWSIFSTSQLFKFTTKWNNNASEENTSKHELQVKLSCSSGEKNNPTMAILSLTAFNMTIFTVFWSSVINLCKYYSNKNQNFAHEQICRCRIMASSMTIHDHEKSKLYIQEHRCE